MKTTFPKNEHHIPKWFIIDAQGKTLGRIATKASALLLGKYNTFFTPGIDQGSFVVIINAAKICISGKKDTQKLYFRNSQRPGSLKSENFKLLKSRIPTRIIEKAVWGMLPAGVLGRNCYRRLYVYSNDEIKYKKASNGISTLISSKSFEEHNCITIKT